MSSKRTCKDVTFEFGRRLKGEQGTNVAAQPIFMVGGADQQQPIRYVSGFEQPGFLGKHSVQLDFRQVYVSILDNWLEIDLTTLLGSEFDELSVFQ